MKNLFWGTGSKIFLSEIFYYRCKLWKFLFKPFPSVKNIKNDVYIYIYKNFYSRDLDKENMLLHNNWKGILNLGERYYCHTPPSAAVLTDTRGTSLHSFPLGLEFWCVFLRWSTRARGKDEAATTWWKPEEICEVLCTNSQKNEVLRQPRNKPGTGLYGSTT